MRRGAQGGEDGVVWRGGALGGRGRADATRADAHSGVSYNPLSPRTAQDPYPVYAALRARDPVHGSRLLNAWLVTRHRDVDAVLQDHRRFGNDPRTGTRSSRQRAMLPPPEEFTLLFLDPPGHTRLRAFVVRLQTNGTDVWSC